MDVLHVISSIDPKRGGPGLALVGLALAQKRTGINPSVAATFENTADLSLAEKLTQSGIPVYLIGPCWRLLAWHWSVGKVLRRLVSKAVIVHNHGLWEEIHHQAARAASRAGVPYIVRPCGMLDPWSLAQQRLKKKLFLALRVRKDLDGAQAMHFTTEVERRLTEPLALKSASIVEPNGIDFAELEQLPPRGTFRARYPELGGRPLVLFLGRLHYKKGVELLLEAFARIDADKAILVIAGPDWDNYQPLLEAHVGRLKLSERVLFTGMLSGMDRFAALVDADLFVLPSYQENFGIAVVEALAVGTPVIISDEVNIHPEILAAGVGAVVPTQIEPLALAIQRWLHDTTLRQQAAMKSRPFVYERYDWNKIAQRWHGHYEKLSGSPRNHAAAAENDLERL